MTKYMMPRKQPKAARMDIGGKASYFMKGMARIRLGMRSLALTSPRPSWAWRACNPVARRSGREKRPHCYDTTDLVLAGNTPLTFASVRIDSVTIDTMTTKVAVRASRRAGRGRSRGANFYDGLVGDVMDLTELMPMNFEMADQVVIRILVYLDIGQCTPLHMPEPPRRTVGNLSGYLPRLEGRVEMTVDVSTPVKWRGTSQWPRGHALTAESKAKMCSWLKVATVFALQLKRGATRQAPNSTSSTRRATARIPLDIIEPGRRLPCCGTAFMVDSGGQVWIVI